MTILSDVFPDTRDDAELIAATRKGDTGAYGMLFARHVDAARRLARSLASDAESDELVSEAFLKVLAVLQSGEGPGLAMRPYLLMAVRRLAVDRARAVSRVRPIDDLSPYDRGRPVPHPVVAAFESTAAARAFASLPERWQAVLWHTEVEGQRPGEVAALLGMTPNAVSALAYRAREGVRQAFVSMHVQDSAKASEACQTTRAALGAYIRVGLSRREATRVAAHLECCRPCTAIYLELVDVESDLRGVLAPVVLGTAATAYLSLIPVTTGGSGLLGAAGGFLHGLVGGLQRVGRGKVVAGTAGVGVVTGTLVVGAMLGLSGDGRDRPGLAPVGVAPRATSDQPAAPTPEGRHRPGRASASGSPDPHPIGGQATDSTSTFDDTNRPDATSTPDPDLSEVDLTLRADAEEGVGPTALLTVTLTGLRPSQTGIVTITADQPMAAIDLDPRCDLLATGQATCRLPGGGTLHLLATGLPLTSTTLMITAVPSGRLHDRATGDNTARVTLDGRV